MEDVKMARYDIRDANYSRKGLVHSVYNNGFDNRFSDYLDSLYNTSPTHSAIINDLVDYIYGEGLKAKNESKQEILDKFFNKKVTKKIIRNKVTQAAICLEVIKSKAKNIVELNSLNPSQIRVSELHKGMPVSFVYRKSWDKSRYKYYQTTKELTRIREDKYEGLFYWYDSGTFEVPYGRPKYISGLNAIEEEAAIYLMHNHGAQNGFFPSMIISRVTSGDAEQDEKDEATIVREMAGAKSAGKIAFLYRSPGEGNNTEFITPNLSGIDKVYEAQYVQSETGILKAHQIPSPTLISGLNQKPTGFGSAAEEMEYALAIFKKKRINPEREEILEILSPIFESLEVGEVDFLDEEVEKVINPEVEQAEVNDNMKNLTGRQLQNIQRIVRKFNREEITKQQAEQMLKSGYGLTDSDIDVWIGDTVEMSLEKVDNDLIEKGEDYSNDWEVLDVSKVDGDIEQLIQSVIDQANGEISELNKSTFSKIIETLKLVNTGTARPNSKSAWDDQVDETYFKVRYQYAPRRVSSDSREFCRKMVSAAKLYRKEDIDRMSQSIVNEGWGPGGSNVYDIFEFKGGGNCHHYWERVVFMRKGGNLDVNSPVAQRLRTSLRNAISQGYTEGSDPEYQKAKTKPKDMANNGFLRPR